MSILLSGADLIDLAVQTEERGEAFYREAKAQAKTSKARELFAYLAEQEVRHKRVFQGLVSAIVVTEMDPTTWEEALAYIASTVDRAFFTADAPIRAVPQGATETEMINRAIEFEQQTLLFFYALRDLAQPVNRPIIDKIVEEERRHVARLAALREQQASEQP
ncbi:MAG: ferritin family protein [Chloroflexi bacterium]|nr:ferritin family protein [Chloroflexota bacterium]